MSKKAQEEMVGFVLIIVLVVVIGVIFLSISLRNPSGDSSLQSQELASFLSAVSEVTTGCEIPETNPRNIEQLIVNCAKKNSCSDNRNSCDVLQSVLQDIMKESYLVTEGSFVKYYNLTIKDDFDENLINPIFEGVEGCNNRLLFNDKPISIVGLRDSRIVVSLQVCFND